MGMGLDLASIVAALRKLEEEEQNRIKDYGDIAKVLKNNPLIGALANHLLNSLYEKVLAELDGRMIPPKLGIPRDGDQRSELMSITIPK